MREDKFYELMGEIDPEIIAAADRPVPFRQKRGFKLALIAAVLAFAMLLTPVAGAFAWVGYKIATSDTNPDTGNDVESDSQGFLSGGLVGELFGDVNWGAIGDAVGKDGNVKWYEIFDALQGKEPVSSETIGMVGYEAIKLDDGTMKIVNFTASSNETVIEIPETIAGAKVSTIGEGAFKGNQNLTHVSIPDTVTVIEQAAFYGCTNLLTVYLGEGIQEIGEEAFLYCSSLTDINLPDTLHTIGMNAFGKCESLAKIDLPTGLTEISANAFYATPLTEISIPATVISIGDYAFANCSELSEVTFESMALSPGAIGVTDLNKYFGVEYIGAGAFEGTAISSITFPSTLTDIYDIDFKGCMNLEQVIFTGNAPTVHKEPSADKSAPDNKNAPDYTVYYMIGANGFTRPGWNGYTSRLLGIQTEQFVLDHMDEYIYSEVRMYNVEVLGQLGLSGLDEVTVIDSYGEYEAFSHVLTSERYNSDYFEEFAIVLIKVEQASSEQVLGLAGLCGQFYTTGGKYYLGLYPVVKIDGPNGDQDTTDDQFSTYVIAEVQRSDIRTDNVIRVGEVYAYEIDSKGASQYHKGFLESIYDSGK